MKIIIRESYLKMIQNSVGTKMFRNLYLEDRGRKLDATENGQMSCAFFVSNVLLIWKLISEGHATIGGTVEDMKNNGWVEVSVKDAELGDVIVWEEKLSTKGRVRSHIGFYVGNDKTVSHRDACGSVSIHHWTFRNTRKIIVVYRYLF